MRQNLLAARPPQYAKDSGSKREKMSNYLAQNRLAFGLDRSVAVVTWAAKARFRVLPAGNCPGGAEVVRRMAPREPQRIP